MIFHLSIDADDPHGVAQFFAAIWKGIAAPFPPVSEGAWVAFADDDRASLIEVYPRGTELHEGAGTADSVGLPTGVGRRSATHMAIATELGAQEVMALAQARGWPAKLCTRGGKFGVIELFVEGVQMVEVLTPAMQREYLDAMRPENWLAYLAAAELLAAEPLAA